MKSNPDVAVGGLLIALLVFSAIPLTAKAAVILGWLTLAMVWITAFSNGSLRDLVHEGGN
jgi:hypothetical protein